MSERVDRLLKLLQAGRAVADMQRAQAEQRRLTDELSRSLAQEAAELFEVLGETERGQLLASGLVSLPSQVLTAERGYQPLRRLTRAELTAVFQRRGGTS